MWDHLEKRFRDTPVNRGAWDDPVWMDFLVCGENRVLRDFPVSLETVWMLPVPWVRQDFPERRETQESLERMDKMESQEKGEEGEMTVGFALGVSPVLGEIQATLVLTDFLDDQVNQVSQDNQENQVNRAYPE